MSIAVVIDAFIGRPPEVVYDALADVDRWPEWLIATGVTAVTRSSAEVPTSGERMTIDQRAGGRASTVAATVTAADPPTRFAIEGRDADGVTTRLDAALAPVDGGTSLRWSVHIDLPLRYRVFESMASPQVHRAAALDVEALRRRLESADPG